MAAIVRVALPQTNGLRLFYKIILLVIGDSMRWECVMMVMSYSQMLQCLSQKIILCEDEASTDHGLVVDVWIKTAICILFDICMKRELS